MIVFVYGYRLFQMKYFMNGRDNKLHFWLCVKFFVLKVVGKGFLVVVIRMRILD